MMFDNDFKTASIDYLHHDTIVIKIVNPDDKMQNLLLILFILYKYIIIMPYKNTVKCSFVIRSSVTINKQMLQF